MMLIGFLAVYFMFGVGFAGAVDYEIMKRFPDWELLSRFLAAFVCFLCWPFVLGAMVASFFAQAIEP